MVPAMNGWIRHTKWYVPGVVKSIWLEICQDIESIDVGPSPTPYERAEELAAVAYGAGRTWFLTNGATQGNHALCLALAKPGSHVLVQRNSHASVVDGLVLSGGMAHAAGVALAADCAWGSHFGFHPALPESPLRQGADAVLSSTHKIVGSLTQPAMLHVARDGAIDPDEVARCVRLVRSTSPNSLLLASLDSSRRQLASHGEALLDRTLAASARARVAIGEIPGCAVVGEAMVGRRGITEEVVAYLRELTAAGARLHGAADPSFGTIRVLVCDPSADQPPGTESGPAKL
jgi:arginine decarboxylase